MDVLTRYKYEIVLIIVGLLFVLLGLFLFLLILLLDAVDRKNIKLKNNKKLFDKFDYAEDIIIFLFNSISSFG